MTAVHGGSVADLCSPEPVDTAFTPGSDKAMAKFVSDVLALHRLMPLDTGVMPMCSCGVPARLCPVIVSAHRNLCQTVPWGCAERHHAWCTVTAGPQARPGSTVDPNCTAVYPHIPSDPNGQRVASHPAPHPSAPPGDPPDIHRPAVHPGVTPYACGPADTHQVSPPHTGSHHPPSPPRPRPTHRR